MSSIQKQGFRTTQDRLKEKEWKYNNNTYYQSESHGGGLFIGNLHDVHGSL